MVLLTIPLSIERCALGKKSSIAIVNEEGDLEKESTGYERQDFWAQERKLGLAPFPFEVGALIEVDERCLSHFPRTTLLHVESVGPSKKGEQAPRRR